MTKTSRKTLAALLLLTLAAAAYVPPRGVPRPVWGALDPINEPTPTQPAGWPGAEAAGYYYVDSSTGSDSGNTYGTPNAPRATVPSSLAAGAKVWIASCATNITGSAWTGTEANPVWIIGTGAATVQTATVGKSMSITGTSSFVIVDGVTLDGTGISDASASGGFAVSDGANDICLRNCTVSNYPAPPYNPDRFAGGGAGAWYSSLNTIGATTPTGNVDSVVIYNLTCTGNSGGQDLDYESGRHAVHILGSTDGTYTTSNIWLLESDLSDNPEDAVQIGQSANGSDQSAVDTVWIGGCDLSRNGENAIDLKACSNIYIIENDLTGYVPTSYREGAVSGSNGDCVVVNNDGGGPLGVWIVRNKITTSAIGCSITADGGTVNLIANLFYDIFADDSTSPTSTGTAAGVAVFVNNGGVSLNAVDNTIYRVEGGIYALNVNAITVTGNVVLDLYNHSGGPNYLKVQNSSTTSFSGNYGYDPDGTTTSTPGGFTITDPQLTAPAALVFLPSAGSPLIGAGSESAVYASYQAATGQSIKFDRDERIRDGWDAGAFEYVQPAATKFGLASGETVVISGASNTEQMMFSHYLACWWQLQYPDLNLNTFDIGFSGSQLGSFVSTRPSPIPTTYSYHERFFVPMQPDLVLYQLGGNGSYATSSEYTDLWQSLHDVWIDPDAQQLVMLGAFPRQDASETLVRTRVGWDKTVAAANARMWSTDNAFWLCDETEANNPRRAETVQATAEPFGGTDTDHPGPSIHFPFFVAALMGLEAERDVSAVAIDAAAGTELGSYRATVSGISASPTAVSFSRLDSSLPFAIDEAGRDLGTFIYRKCRNWQRYLLRVTNLANGTYSVQIDGEEIGQWSEAELENGINVSDVTTGPVWEQTKSVLDLYRRLHWRDPDTGALLTGSDWGTLHDWEDRTKVTSTGFDTSQLRGSAWISYMDTYFQPMLGEATNPGINEIQAAAEPVTRTWTITQVGGGGNGNMNANQLSVGTLTIGGP